MLKKFKLWLDESGGFKDDRMRKFWNPSLVGGLLFDDGLFDNKIVESIIPEVKFHANENKSAKRNIEIINEVVANNGRLVVFENTKKINIVDSDITYINIFAEGLVKLIEKLVSEYGKIEIQILKARRKYIEHETDKKVIEKNQYIYRIQERVKLWLLKIGIDESCIKWKFEIGDAKDDKRLMICDAICNTFNTRTAKKFDDYKEELDKIINKYIVIPVLNKVEEEEIREYISRENICDAILDHVANDNLYNKVNLQELILNRIKVLNNELVNLQLNIIGDKVESLVNHHRDFEESEIILKRLYDDYINILEKEGIYIRELKYKILISFISLYTHRGEGEKAREYLEIIEEFIKSNSINNVVELDKIFRVKNKLAVLMNDEFDHIGAINLLDSVIKMVEESEGISSYQMAELLGVEYTDKDGSELLGKLLGTRLQSRKFLSRFNKNNIKLAIEDSDRALRIFKNSDGYSRHLQYRAELETEASNFDNALQALKESIAKNDNKDITLGEIVDKIVNTDKINIFNLMHYCRLMGEAALAEVELADEMFKELNKRIETISLFKQDINEKSKNNHPAEIIYWKLATYYGVNNKYKQALKNYDKAIKVIENSENSETRQVIGLAILCEKAHFMKRAGSNLNSELVKTLEVIEQWKNRLLDAKSLSIRMFVEENFSDYRDNLLEVSRKVAY